MFLINEKKNKKNKQYRQKISSGTKNLIALILITNMSYHKTKTKKNQKNQNACETNHGWKT